MPAPPIVVANIISVSYSGSTWLNLMLGSHPESFSVGEMKLLFRGEGRQCSLHGDECSIWPQFDPDSEENVFRQVQRLTGRRFLIVNNSRKLIPALNAEGVEGRYVFLVRDGRATTASYLRKNPGSTMWSAARWWARNVGKRRRFFQWMRPSQYKVVCYEDLVADTAGKLQEICHFLGMSFEPSMLSYWEQEHHYIGGSFSTLTAMASRQKREASIEWPYEASPHSASTTRGDKDVWNPAPTKFLDERWTRELSDTDLRIFLLLAGHHQKAVGYGDVMNRSISRSHRRAA